MPSDPDLIVVNTGPLIALGRIDGFDIVRRLPFRFLVPLEVAAEIERGSRKGYPVSVPSWVEIAESSAPARRHPFLDAGEAAVLQLAIERGIPEVCIDEWRGRRAALASGLRVTGSLGLLGRAKQLGLIPLVSAYVSRLTDAGIHYHPELVRRFLEAMGEAKGEGPGAR
ncbi:MAG: DUF3368 domain-containing protein [Acidobacteria bacterium]|nr:DUF3368 domain-containing protein [Acidobacteriota bacterium]